MLYPQEKLLSTLYYSLKLELRSFCHSLILHISSLSNGGLQVHSNVLTGSVPGYLLGQTAKANTTKKMGMSSMGVLSSIVSGSATCRVWLVMGQRHRGCR